MKRITTTLLLAFGLLALAAMPASADGHGLTTTSVEIENTIESPTFGFDEETPFGDQGPKIVGDTVEFPECCDGFYAIDLSSDQISMKWIGDSQYARVIEDGTFDRYYFTFDEPVLESASLNASSTLPVNVTVTSATELIVEVAPGMEVGDGFDALIDVATSEGTPTELASTGVSSWQLAIIGATIVVAGVMLVGWSRSRTVISAG